MDWVTIIKSIYQRLETNGFRDTSKEIQHEQLKGGTPGEMFTLVVSKLIDIKDQQPEIYAVIKEETDWMILYAKKINYLP